MLVAKIFGIKSLKTKSAVATSSPFSAVQKQFFLKKANGKGGPDTNSLNSISDLYVDAVPFACVQSGGHLN